MVWPCGLVLRFGALYMVNPIAPFSLGQKLSKKNCYVTICYVMLRCAVLSYAMLCYAMLCYAMLCYAMLVLCYAMICYAGAMLCYAMLCYARKTCRWREKERLEINLSFKHYWWKEIGKESKLQSLLQKEKTSLTTQESFKTCKRE